jgi:hypothetical protein
LVLLLVAVACGLDQRRASKPDDEFGAASLDRLDERGSILGLLEPEEREALDRSGMAVPKRPAEAAEAGEGRLPDEETKADKAGKLGISVLGVALTAAVAAAPFFLF